jgi:hypothetical protein
LYQLTWRMIKPSAIIVVRYHCYQIHTKFYWMHFSQG